MSSTTRTITLRALVAAGTAVLAALMVSGFAHAAEIEVQDVQELKVLTEQLKRCAVLPFGYTHSGKRIYGTIRSGCDEVSVDGPQARALSKDAALEIRVLPSDSNNGKNLWDIVIWNQEGRKLLELSEIPGRSLPNALDSALRALGVDPEISVYDPTLNEL